jgi:hypothetical protein
MYGYYKELLSLTWDVAIIYTTSAEATIPLPLHPLA